MIISISFFKNLFYLCIITDNLGENMSVNERFDFEKIGDYRKKIIDTNYKEIEKFDINRKFNKFGILLFCRRCLFSPKMLNT